MCGSATALPLPPDEASVRTRRPRRVVVVRSESLGQRGQDARISAGSGSGARRAPDAAALSAGLRLPKEPTLTERDGYEHGVPCWVDTWQQDADAAATFYAGVFGWEVEKGTPPGTDTRYYMC